MRFTRLAVVLWCSSCVDLTLPMPPPPPGPGTLQGTLVYAQPGRTVPAPARGARVELLESSTATRADDEGRFQLTGLTSATGVVRMSFDLDGDGTPDRQRVLTLASVSAGPGRDVALGEVVLGRNARLTGLALRGDLPGPQFHLGTTVFITGMEFSTFTADNGGYALDGLPEGPVQVSFFRPNYQPDSREVALAAGQELRLSEISLRASPSAAATASGLVQSSSGAPLANARLRAVSTEGETTASSRADGTFSLGPVPSGPYLIGVERAEFVSAFLGRKLLVAGANDLGVISLAAGTSMTLALDAGTPAPQPDAGMAGGGAAGGGSVGGGSAGGGSIGGGSAGGGSIGGGSAGGGSIGGGSAGGGSVGGGSGGGAAGGGSVGGGSVGGGSVGGGSAGGGSVGGGSFGGGSIGGGSSAGGSSTGGGSSGGSSAGGSSAGGSSTGGGSAGGGSIGGGSTGGGSAGGGSVDAGVPCDGLCAPGFVCDATDRCRSTACGQQSCALCNGGQCFTNSCGAGLTCGPGDVCARGSCVPLSCASVTCASGSLCANGACLPTSCSATVPCRSGFVCSAGACVDARCVGRSCGPGALCVEGTCYPTGTPGNPCGLGYAYIDGQCREAACEGVTCGPGTQCGRGQCLSGGLYVAGVLRPRDAFNPAQFRYGLAGSVGGRWVKLATFPDPVDLLDVSPDGTWLFARTRSSTTTTLYRSQDGRSWTSVFSGTTSSNGAIEDLHIDEATGTLTLSIAGFQVNGLHRILSSTDNGNTWTPRYLPEPNLALGIRSYAPPNLFTSLNPTLFTPETLCQFHVPPLPDGGSFTQLVPQRALDAFLISDRRGEGPTFVSHPAFHTFFLDGGLAGTFSAAPRGAVYGPRALRQVMLLTETNVARTLDDGATWSFRAPAVSSPEFIGMVRGADDALYVANVGTTVLFASTDDGESWAPVPTNWASIGLSAWWPEWAPNTAYTGFVQIQPSDPKATGFLYRLTVGGTTGSTEPDWADAGTGVVVDGTARWVVDIVPPDMRPTAMTSRVCTPGQLRCGTGCVDIATSALHCGGCDRPCSTTCVAGQCLSASAPDGGGVSIGCADGTREGFTDVTLYPSVAACSGEWTGDLDVSSSPEALCASGWHVCDAADTEVRALSTAQATAFPGCFAFRASVDGFNGCEPLDCSNAPSHDDVAAVGADCLALSGVVRLPAQVADGGACFADRGVVASQCCSNSVAGPGKSPGCPQRGESGVVCCR